MNAAAKTQRRSRIGFREIVVAATARVGTQEQQRSRLDAGPLVITAASSRSFPTVPSFPN